MSSQAVTLRVPVDDDWDAGTALQVYTDFGGGTVDTDRPLLTRPVEVFPEAVLSQGFGLTSFGLARFGDNKPARQHNAVFGREVFGVSPFTAGKPYVEITVDVPPGFGQWKFAIEAIDGNGDIQSGGLQELTAVVSGTEPAPPASLAFNSYDSGTDQVTFDFTLDAE